MRHAHLLAENGLCLSMRMRQLLSQCSSDMRNIVSIATNHAVQINFHNDFVFIARLVPSSATCQLAHVNDTKPSFKQQSFSA